MTRRTSRVAVLVFGALMSFAAGAVGQTSSPASAPEQQPTPIASPEPSPSPSPSLEKNFFVNILHDQKAIWLSPLKVSRADAKWLAPLGLSTAALIATDRHTAGAMINNHNQTRLNISNAISQLGAGYTTGGVAAAFYLIGRAKGDARAKETGLLSGEALIDSAIVIEAAKLVSQRPRPHIDDASGEFFDIGTSFPSGHAVSAWSLATVIASEYGKKRPLLRFGIYGLATAVSVSRFTAEKHFLSDALVGSAVGYGIGRYVYRQHHDRSLDGSNGGITKSIKRSRWVPFVAPIYSRQTRTYGGVLAWSLGGF